MVREPILHLVAAGDLDLDAPLGGDGALHCATVDQAAGLARLLHAGTEDLVLVVIDPDRLGSASVRWTDPYGIGRELPCIEGAVPRSAIVEVVPFPPGPGGRWMRPRIAPLEGA